MLFIYHYCLHGIECEYDGFQLLYHPKYGNLGNDFSWDYTFEGLADYGYVLQRLENNVKD